MAKKAKKAKAAKAGVTGSVVKALYQDGRYTKSDVKTASGKRFAQDVGDPVAKKLRGVDMKGLKAIAKEAGLGSRFDEKWSQLNPGLCRMALGNALRGLNSPNKKKAAKKAAKEKAD